MLSQVRKRNGALAKFDREKIRLAISAALQEVQRPDESLSLMREVLGKLGKQFTKVIPSVEDIQDYVEEVFVTHDMHDAAKAYILYRNKHEDIREIKNYFGVQDDLKLSLNAITVLQKRYLRRDSSGKIIETPEQLFSRVAKHVASAEKKDKAKWEKEFFTLMKELDFLPNTPCLVNAGTKMGQLFACFVLPVPDSIEGIFETVKNSAVIFQTGGGVGYSFSGLRHEGSMVSSTHHRASGPVSFMEVFDKGAEVIKQGGVRRAALMGVLRVDHPDIFHFIGEKSKGSLSNFNVSVGVTGAFMWAVIHNKNYWLKDHEGNRVQEINARDVFDFLCGHAWECGDPGMLFLDEINKKHSLKKLGKIEATNPCGEVLLLPNEACVLGSINLSHMVEHGHVQWAKLAKSTELGVRFLDNLITLNAYPLPEIKNICEKNRKIGLGVMGWADMLIALGVRYDSDKAMALAKEIIHFIRKHAELSSEKLGREKGVFGNYKKSSLKRKKRNATVLSIAPTGSISIIAGCSSGIEPLFGVSYVRNVLSGTQLFEVHTQFEHMARYKGFYSKELMMKIAERGTVQGLKEVPSSVQELFKTSLDIPLEGHVKMQAAFQEGVDNAVSKTINLPNNATIGDVKRAYMLAWKSKCKGITIYRYGSKPEQVLYLGEESKGKRHMQVDMEHSGGCIGGQCSF
ncbi:adenosylcobalamin-dependent ribonucleoside-diphosphate reductase [Candidatus Woesearchaeota archaeon]|nr:adenosylcobalamin-dependent ribonucleoside-diphosphate reductase [Candidatus Woesearchaeota archaeon]